MNDSSKGKNLSNVATEAQAAVERGGNIRDMTRNITLAALSKGRLDTESARKVVHSVMQGANLGASKAGNKSRQALKEAVAGIDEALAKSAEASMLAIEEASGRLQNYGKRDLERAFNDLRTLEAMFLDTLKDVADHTVGETREILHGLLQHARDSGTHAGGAASEAISTLEMKLGRTLREIAAAGTDAALNVGFDLAEAASGFLAGIADTLHAKANSINKENK